MRAAALLASLLAATACVRIPARPGLDDVTSLLDDRLPQRVEWIRDVEEDRRVAEELRAILARPLSADDAVQVALLRNGRLQATYARLGVSQADLVEAGLLDNPVLATGVQLPDGSGRARLRLGVVHNFLRALMIPARKRIAAIQFERTRLEVADEVLRLASEVRVAYYALQGSGQLASVLEHVVEAAAASAALAERLHAAGNLSDLGLAQRRAVEGMARIEHERSALEQADRREELHALLGLGDDGVEWTIPERLPELPDEQPSVERLETLAATQRLDLAAAGKEVEALAEALGVTRRWRLFLAAELGIESERETDGQWVTGPELSFELPLFDRRQADVARLEHELEASESRLRALATEMQAEVRALGRRVHGTARLVAYYRDEVLPLQRSIVDLTQREYNFMLADVFSLLAVKQDEIRAHRDYVHELRDYWIAVSRLERAVGGRLDVEARYEPEERAVPRPEPEHHHHGGP